MDYAVSMSVKRVLKRVFQYVSPLSRIFRFFYICNPHCSPFFSRLYVVGEKNDVADLIVLVRGFPFRSLDEGLHVFRTPSRPKRVERLADFTPCGAEDVPVLWNGRDNVC